MFHFNMKAKDGTQFEKYGFVYVWNKGLREAFAAKLVDLTTKCSISRCHSIMSKW
jgi:hypothetical protein